MKKKEEIEMAEWRREREQLNTERRKKKTNKQSGITYVNVK